MTNGFTKKEVEEFGRALTVSKKDIRRLKAKQRAALISKRKRDLVSIRASIKFDKFLITRSKKRGATGVDKRLGTVAKRTIIGNRTAERRLEGQIKNLKTRKVS